MQTGFISLCAALQSAWRNSPQSTLQRPVRYAMLAALLLLFLPVVGRAEERSATGSAPQSAQQREQAVSEEYATPAALLQTVLKRLETEGDPAVILPFIHWPSAFDAYGVEERRKTRIESAEELERYMSGALRDPQALLMEETERRADRLPEQMRTQFSETMRALADRMGDVQQLVRKRVAATSYAYQDLNVQNDRATATVTARYQGREHHTPIDMRRIDGRWYLSSVAFAKSEGGRVH